jgi:ribosomal-protein-alanine N-acetyltransferase
MAGFAQPHILVDDELLLRPWRTSDAPAALRAFSTPDIQHYHFRHFETDHDALDWIEYCAKGWREEKSATWAIVDRSTDEVLGRVTIMTFLEDGYGEVSYWVLPVGRGGGVATRACVAATEWAHELGLHRIGLEHSTANDASRRVALAARFVEEGVKRSSNLHADGWHDMRLYSHLPSDSP